MISNKLTKDAGIEFPIICGAMYPCSNPELVAAASEGGGIGIIQPVSMTMVHGYDNPNRKEGLRAGIRKIKSLTNKPIGFNALIEKGSKKYLTQMSEWIDVALEEGIRFFVTSLGKPDWVCDKVHLKGGLVYHDVTNLKWAEKGKKCNVDGLICVNDRAGGHLGQLSMEELYLQLSPLGLPLVCAGGIGSELELKRAIELGYDGVQMGTRFIATNECNTPQDYKDAIVDANENDITWTTKLTGIPISVIKSSNFKKHNSWFVRKMLKGRFKHRMRLIITTISFFRMKAFSNSKKKSSRDLWSAGKSVHSIKSIDSATNVMRSMGELL